MDHGSVFALHQGAGEEGQTGEESHMTQEQPHLGSARRNREFPSAACRASHLPEGANRWPESWAKSTPGYGDIGGVPGRTGRSRDLETERAFQESV